MPGENGYICSDTWVWGLGPLASCPIILPSLSLRMPAQYQSLSFAINVISNGLRVLMSVWVSLPLPLSGIVLFEGLFATWFDRSFFICTASSLSHSFISHTPSYAFLSLSLNHSCFTAGKNLFHVLVITYFVWCESRKHGCWQALLVWWALEERPHTVDSNNDMSSVIHRSGLLGFTET